MKTFNSILFIITLIIVSSCTKDKLIINYEENKNGVKGVNIYQIQVDSANLPDFYEGNIVDEDELLRHLNFATIANLVGDKVISKATEAGIIDKNCIIKIQGIPHAQITVHSF